MARLSGQEEIQKESLDSGTVLREGVSGIGVAIWKLHDGRMTERWAFWEQEV